MIEDDPLTVLEAMTDPQRDWLETVVSCADERERCRPWESGGPAYVAVSKRLEKLGCVTHERHHRTNALLAKPTVFGRAVNVLDRAKKSRDPTGYSLEN